MKTELEERTKKFAVRVVKAVAAFPKTSEGQIIGRQLLRAGTSIGANYREANRAEFKNDFVHKVGVAEKEAAETIYWLEICRDTGLGAEKLIAELLDESGQLLAILITIGRKTRKNL
ncbi:MAG TPA: four helix bundle protein [Candidatus Paceibacterota bacterium]|nr:four helix bundle protein [Candidatus Paceibacterota bacterium]